MTRVFTHKNIRRKSYKTNHNHLIIFFPRFHQLDIFTIVICVYDKETKALERFEPYGKSKRDCTNPIDIDIKIKELFKENLGDDFINEYYEPLDFIPTKGFQSLQEDEGDFKKKNKGDPDGGFCAAWVAWYAELRIQNPNKDRKRLVEIALKRLKNSDRSMTKYIRDYSASLTV